MESPTMYTTLSVKRDMKKLRIALLIIAAFWFVIFSPWTAPHINFWYAIMLGAGALIGLSLWFGKDWKRTISFNLKDLLIGIGSAAILWCIFYLGNEISNLLFDFARSQVDTIYVIKEGQNQLLLTLALVFWIGPAEELFWRGYIQRRLEDTKYGKWGALIITTIIYALVHIWAFNFMLLMAAVVCGLFWGLLYMVNRNLLTLFISHALWDVAIFILFPIM